MTNSLAPLDVSRQKRMANAVRALSMDAVEKAKSGHPGMPMGMADVATVLFTRHLKFDPATPAWPDRDRFILSAGHGSMLIYSLLHLTGYADLTLDEIKNFRQWGARTAGHPEFGHAAGIETTTGPLGQGIANSVGFALAERVLNAKYGDALVDHRTYVIAGDGCLMEGISQEAISLAGHLKLNRLIVLWDDNQISIDGPISMSSSEDQAMRFQAAGWNVLSCDGHDAAAIDAALTAAKTSDKPVLIACRTTIGYGAPKKAGTSGVHGSPLGAEEIAGARAALDWPYAPFEIPDDIRADWLAAGSRGAAEFAAWTNRLDQADAGKRAAFEAALSGELPANFADAVATAKAQLVAEAPSIATRQASQKALEVLAPVVPTFLGGSADLTGSNLTKIKADTAVSADNYGGSYVYYGIREHGMAAAMNGLALHGGIIPFGGTFLVFTDYCRPSIRLSALMNQKVIYVMTHDSIGLGEDGPTHQPVEHMAALRCIPNLKVFRPADAVETLEAWALAVSLEGPSVLALSRQAVPSLRKDADAQNLSARGAYVLSPAKGDRKATLLATGTEVSLAIKAQATLAEAGIPVAVVSMPSWELFAQQDAAYRAEVLGTAPRIAIEAASGFGWDRFTGETGLFIGMQGFGASAPAERLYAEFGITADAIVAAVKARV
ncbi:transketolase [Elstera cyanobacteriorum]|uniref:Transketolase n=1 Tax=Elstera cyanobacteriorum TaxID=2022747 RepID=A0A255XK82_9PROT|nr:transketolase [Elstera cyanobacteriorum]OYQ16835.1 transketolase [Elstera cyanobacteriorum]GFZ88873.1 transketolase [Elstera cyanobacteriorum]